MPIIPITMTTKGLKLKIKELGGRVSSVARVGGEKGSYTRCLDFSFPEPLAEDVDGPNGKKYTKKIRELEATFGNGAKFHDWTGQEGRCFVSGYIDTVD
jgi:hypothetical protein